MRAVFVIIALLSIAPAYATIFKCTVNGKVEFSDQPCGTSQEEITVEAGFIGTNMTKTYDDNLFYRHSEGANKKKSSTAQQAKVKNSCPSDNELKKEAWKGKVLLCMTQEQVMNAAQPKFRNKFSVDSWIDEKGKWEMWRYFQRKGDWPYAIKFKNGRVTALISTLRSYESQFH